MKKITLFTLIFTLSIAVFAQKLSVLIDYKSYYAPTDGAYLEISSFVNGKTVAYLPDEQGKFQAEVRITVQAFQEDSLINKLDYILVSEPFVDADASTKPNFGTVQNMQLPTGEYVLLFSVQDMQVADSKPIDYADVAILHYPQDEVSISDISLYRSISRDPQGDIFDKYGLALDPLFYGFVPETMYALPFSCEIYNTDKLVGSNEPIIIKSYITCFENNLMPYPEAFYTTQTKAKPVVVTLGEIGIFKLPSGNYNLIVDVFSKDSVLLAANSYFFQRSNPNVKLNLDDINLVDIQGTFVDKIENMEQLLEFVRFLFPISTPLEREFYSTRMNLIPMESLQKFFYSFWLKRDHTNPEQAWRAYFEQVKYVNREFGCKLVQGYRTDRGRVYLQYGPPNSRFESPYDSHSYPYEIWHYYHCVDQSNVKFIFYNTDLVSNDYDLLHSDKRGELQDPFWKLRVTQRKTPIYNFDQLVPEDYFGGNPKDDWFNHR